MQLTPNGTLYDRIGPEHLHALLTRFYRCVGHDPLLAPLFPDDLGHTLEKQFAFMSGFLGGPPLYHQRFGHPRLRARHLPFPITPEHARAWLSCMKTALDETPQIERADAAEYYAALTKVALHMVNSPSAAQEPTSGEGQAR
ncbi:globin [Deinococcus peraridilitoris]|uniref:globin domain-containing protein n=1 Tax=Deinococcus peraridilitoris TaxID=432329 RepID=UPI0002DDFDB8|nr:globin [Deinococcus peraridilitoris]